MKEFKFKIGDQNYAATVNTKEGGLLEVTVNGKSYTVDVEGNKPAAPVVVRPAAPASVGPVSVPTAPQVANPTQVAAPLPGTIVKIVVADGALVKKGDVLVVMEAMKMANDIVAEADGLVKKVLVTVGQNVNSGEALVDFQPANAPAAAPAAKPAAAPAPKAAPLSAGASTVNAPLPGTITKVNVKVGDEVAAGDTVVLMEAMKMENSITTEFAGKVKAVLVEAGAQVQSGQALVELA